MKLQFKGTVWAVAFAALMSIQAMSAGKPFEGRPFGEMGALSRPESTTNILELARRNKESGYRLEGLSQGQRDLLKNLSDRQVELMRRYEDATKLSGEARREAYERLHDEFWRVMDRDTVQRALGHEYTPKALNEAFSGILKDYRTTDQARRDVELSNSLARSVAHMEALHLTAEARGKALEAAYTSAVSTRAPHLMDDAVSLLRESNEPTTVNGLKQMFEMMEEAHKGTLPGMNGKGWAHDSTEMKELKSVVDFTLANGGTNKDLWDISKVVTQMMNAPDGVDALHGMNALFKGPADAVRKNAIELARKYGVLDGLKADAVRKAKEAGVELKPEEVDAALSTRGTLEKVKETLKKKAEDARKPGGEGEAKAREYEKELADLEKHNTETSTKALVEAMLKINKDRKAAGERDTWSVIKDLFNKLRRPCCVPVGALALVGGTGFLLAVNGSDLPPDEKKAAKEAYCYARATGPSSFSEGTDMSVCANVKVPQPTDNDNTLGGRPNVGVLAPNGGTHGNQPITAPVAPSGPAGRRPVTGGN